ncbi:MAG TPA: c-type cytochrome, partial [Terriglobia bacterium]|nr:c-type cytochrome [Terriglobia bacterium]
TVWDGVFTAAQARRGRAAYTANCASCHMDDLGGNQGEAPALKGAAFMERWRDYPLRPLVELIETEMPPLRFRTPETPRREHQANVDILAYLLEQNGFPRGQAELTQTTLGEVFLLDKDGPQPPPNFALVLSVGCLVLDTPTRWTLVNATEPVRATRPDDTTPEELMASATRLLGRRQFRVADLGYLGADFSPVAYRNHRVQIKGYLIRQPEFERISVTSIGDIARNCP